MWSSSRKKGKKEGKTINTHTLFPLNIVEIHLK